MEQSVILVDSRGRRIGTEQKLKAHSNGGIWHRAISIFAFNDKGETLLQRRAFIKYHTPGKWSNTCCSHPAPGEKAISAAHRRLMEEMGFSCKLKNAFMFKYEADVGKGLTEKEYDYIFFGRFNGEPKPNSDEVSEYKWMGLQELTSDISKNPDSYTPWLRLMIGEVSKKYMQLKDEI